MATCPFGEHGRTWRVLAAVSLGLAQAAAAWADSGPPDVANPELFQCIGRNHFSGKVDIPVEKQDDAVSWPYAAFFVDPVYGTSLIVYGPGYREVGALMQAFIRRHECQHAKGVRDEITANCNALAQMRAQGLTPQQEGQLERWHLALGTIGSLRGADALIPAVPIVADRPATRRGRPAGMREWRWSACQEHRGIA